jgi:Domain of unknown function (DUF4129)
MAVDSLELKPRASVALLDAAVRLCGRALGVWSIVLPAGAALTWALFEFVEALRLNRPTLWPATALAAAWLFRALSQGAACHHLETTVLGAGEPDTWASWKAALYRTPSLLVVCAHNLVLNVVLLTVTLGFGLIFLGAHYAGYAVALRGEGSPLATYFTCARLLGPSRHSAGWLKVAGLSQLVVAFNLHLGTSLALKLVTTLVAIDVTFADRFASLDNPVWLATLAAITFALFEPLRAACATLLLVDGRVRQEGLDLVAAVEQLPLRRRKKPTAAIGAALLLVLAGGAARAQDDWKGVYFPGVEQLEQAQGKTSLTDRLRTVASECGLDEGSVVWSQLQSLGGLPQSEQAALTRFVVGVERRAWDEEDCEGALAELEAGLKLAVAAIPEGDAAEAREAAKAILARPEFDRPGPEQDAEAKQKEDEPPEPKGWLAQWWDDFWESFWKWLRQGNERRAPIQTSPSAGGMDLGLTNVVVVGAIILVLVVLLALLLRGVKARGPGDAEAEVTGISEAALVSDPMSALARPPEGWAHLADELAKQGQFREAIRHLYLALLSRLHRDGAIDYDPAKSNWDYFRGFRGAREALGPFKELTLRFDFAWYGRLDVTPQAYTQFRTLTQPLLTAAGEARDA